MTNIALPTLAQAQHAVAVTGEILGGLFTVCTFIGNPLSRAKSTRLASFGHLVLAFGADVQKAQKRVVELSSSSESL